MMMMMMPAVAIIANNGRRRFQGSPQRPCPGGYYAPFEKSELCAPVGKGFSSPANSDVRTACAAGTFAANETSSKCKDCFAGSYSNVQASVCSHCPVGFYNAEPGSASCEPCNPAIYNGLGSDLAEWLDPDQTGLSQRGFFCMQPANGAIYASSNPAAASSSSPTTTFVLPSPTFMPSIKPPFPAFATPTTAPSFSPNFLSPATLNPTTGSKSVPPTTTAGKNNKTSEVLYKSLLSNKMILLPILLAGAVLTLALVVFHRKKMAQMKNKTAATKVWEGSHQNSRKRGRGSVPPPPPPPPRTPRHLRPGFKRDTAASVDDVYLEDGTVDDEEGIYAGNTHSEYDYNDGSVSESGMISYPWDGQSTILGMETSYADAMTVAGLSVDEHEEPSNSPSTTHNRSSSTGADTTSVSSSRGWQGGVVDENASVWSVPVGRDVDGNASVWSVPVGVQTNHNFDNDDEEEESNNNNPSHYWL